MMDDMRRAFEALGDNPDSLADLIARQDQDQAEQLRALLQAVDAVLKLKPRKQGAKRIGGVQRHILEALARDGPAVPRAAILKELFGRKPTNSQRSTFSRAAKLLRQRGLVEAVVPDPARPGRGRILVLARKSPEEPGLESLDDPNGLSMKP